MTQPALDFTPKRIADTSLAVYREIAPSLPRREQQVIDVLRTLPEPPTSYELFCVMHAKGLATDLNAVRPRLTELCDRGRLRKGDKRACAITGKTAYTYVIVHRDAVAGQAEDVDQQGGH
jgi:hypothetical protein